MRIPRTPWLVLSASVLALFACKEPAAVSIPPTSGEAVTSRLGDSHVPVALGTLGGWSSEAHAISPSGTVVGLGTVATGDLHPFLWRDGVMADLGTLGGLRGAAWAINSEGVVVGASTRVGVTNERAFVWKDGIMTDLGTLGGLTSVAFAINPAGTIVGSSTTATSEQPHAVLWHGRIIRDLGTLGGSSSVAYGINERGDVVGMSMTSDGAEHAFRWSGGTMVDLGGLAAHGHTPTASAPVVTSSASAPRPVVRSMPCCGPPAARSSTSARSVVRAAWRRTSRALAG